MKYMVFTAKHHNGFCMWDTKTTDLSIMNSGYGKDILKEIIEAFRKYEISIGLSFSPDDYHVMYKQGYPPNRYSPESESTRNTELWEINKNQLRELLTNYGKIDILYIDEKSDWANPLVANYAWDLDPDLIITRGGMETPEQYIPEKPVEIPWEVSFTIGNDWQHVAEDKYKSTFALIKLIIETRAKGGNLILNIAPDVQGEIPTPQESRLREIGSWIMANHEAIHKVGPWEITHEGDTWFTTSKNNEAVYAFVHTPYWDWMEEKAFFFRSIQGSKEAQVSILGQNDLTMEYQPHRSPKPIFSIVEEGIFVNVGKARRVSKTWSYPLVIKFENVGFEKTYQQ